MSRFSLTIFEKISIFFASTQFLSRISRFSLTAFEENCDFLLLFSFLPEGRNFFSSGQKKSQLFFIDTLFQAFLRFTYSTYAENPKSLQLFQKNFHIRYIAKKSESVQALSGIFPKNLKTFTLFRTFFKKSFYGILRQTRHRHFCNTLCANSPNSPKLPSTGVISKITINCALPF